MKKKMKRGAAWFLAFALTLTGITLTPDYVQAEEPAATETMPEIETPSQVEGIVGEALHTVELPEGWEWAEPEAVIAQGDQTCAVRHTVDDETWDYTEVEGYDPEGHYVERLVQVTGKEKKESNDLGSTEGNGVPVALAEGDVPLDETHFPDEQFRDLVARQVDENGNGILEQSERENCDYYGGKSHLSVWNSREISSLKGIEYLTGLQWLRIDAWGLKMKLGEADLTQNENLETIELEGLELDIGKLDASGLKKLKTVYVNSAYLPRRINIDYIDLSDCSSLEGEFGWFGLCVTSKELNLRNATSLENYSTRGSMIKKIDFTGCTSLEEIDLKSSTDIEEEKRELETIILENVPNLRILKVPNQKVKELDVSGNPKLEVVEFGEISENYDSGIIEAPDSPYPLTKLVLGDQENLKTLQCNYTQLSDIDVSGCPNIETLSLLGNKELTELKKAELPQLTELNIRGTQIEEVEIQECTKLKRLICGDTNIKELNLENQPLLATLECSNTKIKSLDISHNPEIIELDCAYTDISELDISKLTKLTFLSIAHTDIHGLTYPPKDLLYESPDNEYYSLLFIWAEGAPLSAISLSELSFEASMLPVYFTEYDQFKPVDLRSLDKYSEEKKEFEASWQKEYSFTINVESENGMVDMKKYSPDFDPSYILDIEGASMKGSMLCDLSPDTQVVYTYDVQNTKNCYWEMLYLDSKEYCLDDGMSEEEFEEFWESTLLPEYESYWPEIWEELKPELGGVMTVTLNITPANTWETPLSVDDITYGEIPEPLAVPVYGKDTVKYEYSTGQDGTYTEEVPKTVGTYWVRAVVPAGDGYGELVSEGISFEIKKATPQFTLPSGLTAKEGQTLKDVKLPAGFRWADDSQSVGKAGTHTFLAVYTPEDTANYLVVDGIALEVKVSAAEEGGTTEPTDPERPSDTLEKPGKPEDTNVSEKGETPKEKGTSDKDTENEASKDGSPSTGVTDDLVLWLSLLGIAAALAGVTLRKRGR